MKTINTLLLSGGGIRGISYCGVLKRLIEFLENENENEYMKIDIKTLCCVSVGCLFGLIYAIGYKYKEIEEDIINKNFKHLKDTRITNLLTKYGLDSGNNIMSWIETLMIKKGYYKNTTFREIYDRTGINLKVITTNLNRYTQMIFDNEQTPEYEVLEAIRMSISIPFIFTIKKYEDDIHVDGGLINNYPMYLFKDEIDNLLGIHLISKQRVKNKIQIKEIDKYIFNVLYCLLINRDTVSTDENTVCIHTDLEISHSMNFDITTDDKMKLIQIGYEAMNNYLDKMKK
jgi:predicted acylesterase/phospholipase RssA